MWHEFEPICQDKYMIYMYSKGLLIYKTSISIVQELYGLNEQNQS